MKQKIIGLFCVLVLVFLAVYFIPLPVHIDKTVQCVKFYDKGDGSSKVSDDYEVMDIVIRGWYLKYLFKKNIFEGDVIISGVNYMMYDDSSLLEMEIERKFYNSGPLVYFDAITNSIRYYGLLMIEGNFRSILIFGADNSFCVGPAENRADAVNLANDMRPEFKFE